uniref:R3H domain-containing protein 2 n=1 Tax=Cajanus cajan TaxID=3821 RepID=A0A151SE19_CAJCA|nr:R3H domain-containing protein 2 [Cajanus cajan]
MEGSAEDLGAPESWEVADLDESMNRLNLMLSSNKDSNPHADDAPPPPPPPPPPSSSGDTVSDDIVNQVDQFLREAIQNPRERLSILRMEQDVENFIRDPTQQKLEFKQLPTSYLRLAAHRVAQHYSLQSMVLLDSSLPDGSGSRIIVSKAPECKLPAIRLADIPVKLSTENNAVMKVAIKQRPQKRTQIHSNANSNSVKNNNSKSVEERKEEYNRARARIFSSSNNGGTVDVTSSRGLVESSTNSSWGLVESSTNTSRTRSRMEKEPVGRYRQSNRVAIFRDREVDRKDPDYDRSYDRFFLLLFFFESPESSLPCLCFYRDFFLKIKSRISSSKCWTVCVGMETCLFCRYMQRFDPGFGFNGGSYAMQPMYTAVLNYNTEFPQLGSTHRPQLSTEHQPRPLPQHIPGPWAAQSTPAGIGYGHPETMMPPFSPNQVGAHSSSAMYLHSSQYPCQRPGMPFIHHEHVHQPFAQSHQPPPDASFGLARPR